MVLTLQFIRPLYRDKLIQTILQGLNENGCLILVEKVLGEDSMFPGYLQYSEELRKVDEALEMLKRVKGSDMKPELKSEMVPALVPEIGTDKLEFSGEVATLSSKRDTLLAALQAEVARVAEAIGAAESALR